MDYQTQMVQWRRAAELSQADVAERIGTDRSTVACWKSGKLTPSGAQILRLSALYHISPQNLIRCITDNLAENLQHSVKTAQERSSHTL